MKLRYIVLSNEQYEKLMAVKERFKNLLVSRGIDFIPTPLKTGEWVLNEHTLRAPEFSEIAIYLDEKGALDNLVIRSVEEDEFLFSDLTHLNS